MTPIVEQLKDFCDCLPDKLTGDDTLLERNISELIHLISLITCWTQEPCENFLNSARQEIIDVGSVDKCSCNGGIVEFTPYYAPFYADTFKVYIISQSGLETTKTEISSFAYDEIFDVLRIDVSDYVVSDKCTCCPPNYKLLIEYDAGYELIPDCLLQLFCDLLHVVYDKNNCDCSACQACTNSDDVEIEYSEDDGVSPLLSVYLDTLIATAYKEQLGLMSLCGRGRNTFLGMVV